MKKKIAALIVTGAALSTAMIDVQAAAIIGTRSCGEWVANNRKAGFAQTSDHTWLLGFLSGLALGLEKDFLKGMDAPSLYLWVDNYCQANPLQRVDDAGKDLARELIAKKRL